MENLYSLYKSIETGSPNAKLTGNFTSNEISDLRKVLENAVKVRDVVLKVNRRYIASAAMSDEYRNESSSKLQGSYRNMNKLMAQVQPILKEEEIAKIVSDHYQNESQTLTTGSEYNMLQLKELMGIQSDSEMLRWDDIKKTFMKNKMIRGLDEGDRMNQIVALLAQLGEGLEGIKNVLNKN